MTVSLVSRRCISSVPGLLSIGWFWHDRKVQDKSNEITAIPAELELLDIKGCIVTLDAMGTRENYCGSDKAVSS